MRFSEAERFAALETGMEEESGMNGKKLVNDVLRAAEIDAEETDRLKEDCGLDSLSLVSVVVALEEAAGVTFDDGDLDPAALRTVRDLITLAEKYL